MSGYRSDGSRSVDARAALKQRRAFEALRTRLGLSLLEEARLVELPAAQLVWADAETTFLEARRSGEGRLHEGLTRSELSEAAAGYFSEVRAAKPQVMMCNHRELGAIELPERILAANLLAFLDNDGDTIFGLWVNEFFSFDFTADLGERGYEFFRVTRRR